MERWVVAAFIFAAVSVGMAAQAWISWLDHKRRSKALDVIKAAIEAGREPPRELYEQLESSSLAGLGFSKRPWGEAIMFAAVAIGFWFAFGAAGDAETREKFMLVAAIMSVTAVGCAGWALFAPGRRTRDEQR